MLAKRDFHLQTGNLGYKTGLSFTNGESWVTNGILGLLFTNSMHINLNAMGTRMKRRRKELKMSQAELAEKVNVSNNHISSIETGKQIPSLTTFVKICEQLDTTPDFLLLGSLHTDNLPKNIYDSLALCNKKDLPLIQDIVENFVSKRE